MRGLPTLEQTASNIRERFSRIKPAERISPVNEKAKQIVGRLTKVGKRDSRAALQELATFSTDTGLTEKDNKGLSPSSPVDTLADEPKAELPSPPEDAYRESISEMENALLKRGSAVEQVKRNIENSRPSENIKREIKHRTFDSSDRLKHNMLLAEARLRGLKNPQQFLELIEFFESNIEERVDHPYERHRGKLSPEKRQEAVDRWRKRGYYVSIFEYDGYTSVDPWKYTAFNLKRSDISTLIHLANASPKALEAIKILYHNNMYLSAYDVRSGETISDIIRLINAHNPDNVLHLVEGVGGTYTGLTPGTGIAERQVPLRDLIAIAENPELAAAYTPEVIEKIDIISIVIGRKVLVSNLEKYKNIALDPVKFELVTQLGRTYQVPSESDLETFNFFDNIDALVQAGYAQPLITLCKAGVRVDAMLFSGHYRSSYRWNFRTAADVTQEDILQSLDQELQRPEVVEFLASSDLQQYAQFYEYLLGKRFIPTSALPTVERSFDRRQNIVYMMRLMSGGSLQQVSNDRESREVREGLFNMASDIAVREEQVSEVFKSPSFREFLQGLQNEFGYKPKLKDFYDFRYRYVNDRSEGGSILFDLFSKQSVRESVVDPKIVATIKFLHPQGRLELSCFDRYVALSVKDNITEIMAIAREKGLVPAGRLDHNALATLEGISSFPLLQQEILAKLPEGEKERWMKTVIRYPGELQNLISGEISQVDVISEKMLKKNYVIGELHALIAASPSREIKRLEVQLLDQLWRVENPSETFKEIQSVFEKNNLPLVGKIYRVFEIIYDRPNVNGVTLLDQRLSDPQLSPVLRNASPAQRRAIIYRDLLGVHVKSENPSLLQYMNILEQGQTIVQKFESQGEDSLTSGEQLQLGYFLDKMDMLYVNSLLGRTIEHRRRERNPEGYQTPSTQGLPIGERIAALRVNFHVRRGQSLVGRIEEMYLKPLGFASFQEAMGVMRAAKQVADARNRRFALEAESAGGVITLAPGDRLKGIISQFFGQIMENGSVAKEYLGSSTGSDATPFDTDTSLILQEDLQEGFRSAFDASIAKGYGDLLLIVRDRGQFNQTTGGISSYESFPSGIIGDRHYGIRTGFPSTEIDGIVAPSYFRQRDNNLDSVFLTIAQNGFYIPVVDEGGKIIFTPEMYDQYRSTFNGIDSLHGDPFTVKGLREISPGDVKLGVINKTLESLKEVEAKIRGNEPRITSLSGKVRGVISQVLEQNGIHLRDPYDTSIFGGELFDTGSTGRLTSEPGSFDFDYMLLLDSRDAPKFAKVAEEIRSALSPTQDKSHIEQDYIQIRAIGAKSIGEEPIDIDVGVGKRGDYTVFGSHDAVNAKLSSIREKYGDEAYYEVLANIVLAKKILKEGGAYKKLEDGGFGRIGTENWILAHNGNILDAFKSFYDAGHEQGMRVSLDEFKRRYRVFDAGINVKYQKHDNFIDLLKPQGYESMLKVIGTYLEIVRTDS